VHANARLGGQADKEWPGRPARGMGWWLLDPALLLTKSNQFKLVDSVDVKPFRRSYQTSEKLYQPRIGVITLSIRIEN